MKAICTKLACFLLVLLVSGVAMAESITSPNGQLQLNFSVNAQGEPVYELSYKGKPVINPSKLGLELKNDPGLMNGFTMAAINGIKLDEREYITGGVIDNAVSDMAYELTGVSFNYKVYYAGELVQEPQVSVIDAQGNDVTADYVDAENGLKDYEATASPEFIAGVQDMVQSFCETYVYHIYRKASVDSVAVMMEDGSEAERLLYNAQSTLAWAWVPETVEILDESYDEFMYYNDSYFSCRSTINIRKADSKTTEDEEFICQWLFKKVNGQWLVTYFVLG